jgi:peptide/nickel transport system permease protein
VLARYLLWRLLLAIPTTFAILLVLFGLVNLVPSAAGIGDGGETVSGDVRTREARRIFREHYGLNQPVFLNLRHEVTPETIGSLIGIGAAAEGSARLDAEERLLEYGRFAVPALIAIAGDPRGDGRERDLALRVLPGCAREIVRPGDPPAHREAGLALAREIAPLALDREPTAAERELLAIGWARHLERHAARYAPPRGFAALRVTLGETRFATYLRNVVRLDFGIAMSGRQPVLPEFLDRLARSVWIGFGYLLVAFSAAIPLALYSESRVRRATRRVFDVIAFGIYSLPSFFVALLLQRWFAGGRPFSWFPVGGFRSVAVENASWPERAIDVAHHLWLPVWIAALPAIVVLTRLLRTSLADALGSDYAAAARARGVSRRAVIVRHALRNALIPLATMFGAMVPVLISGLAAIEFMFDIPGVGVLLLDAVLASDYNVILCVTLFSAIATQLGYLTSDVLCARLDPRIRLGAAIEGARR